MKVIDLKRNGVQVLFYWMNGHDGIQRNEIDDFSIKDAINNGMQRKTEILE